MLVIGAWRTPLPDFPGVVFLDRRATPKRLLETWNRLDPHCYCRFFSHDARLHIVRLSVEIVRLFWIANYVSLY